MNIWSTVDAGAKPALQMPWPELSPAFSAVQPKDFSPVLFASPHSGRCYPQSFQNQSQLDPLALRASEDAWVDELFAAANDYGGLTLSAHFPRAMVDVNRDAAELDPSMYADHCPPMAARKSARTLAGLGVIPRIVAAGVNIYGKPLAYAETVQRLQYLYTPYHAALAALLRVQKQRFGKALLIDCHSMPASSAQSCPGGEVDFVLGDGHGRTCSSALSARVEQGLIAMGYRVVRNTPYSGGYATLRYGSPPTGIEALQIEINRSLYMDERSMQKTQEFSRLQHDLRVLSRNICAFARA